MDPEKVPDLDSNRDLISSRLPPNKVKISPEEAIIQLIIYFPPLFIIFYPFQDVFSFFS